MESTMTPTFRMSYPNVFTPRKNELSGKDEYGTVCLFEKGENLSKLEALCRAAMEKKWGKDQTQWPKPIRSPFRDQGEKAKMVDGKRVLPAGHVDGAIFINLKSSQRPGVVDQNVQRVIDESQIYAGCYARATITAYAYEQKGNRGVAFGLVNLQKVKDGEPLSGRNQPEADFVPVEGAGETATTASGLFS